MCIRKLIDFESFQIKKSIQIYFYSSLFVFSSFLADKDGSISDTFAQHETDAYSKIAQAQSDCMGLISKNHISNIEDYIIWI